MYIGLISDTHGSFDPEIREFLSPVDELWHAGDFGSGADFAAGIAAFKPLVGVYGNCDGQDIRHNYPSYQYFEREGLSVLMTHIGGSPGHYDLRAQALIEHCKPQIFVCGHSHILKVMQDRHFDMLYVNPGACGNQGWHTVKTALRFKIEAGEIKNMEVFNLPRNNHVY
ncbi:MAG: metallophosphoesterase family protein [Bacteroidales bacterium]|nr:metallophosphoesterase family protein [Bacteroidales bacterium]